MPNSMVGAIAALILLATGVGVFLPTLGGARRAPIATHREGEPPASSREVDLLAQRVSESLETDMLYSRVLSAPAPTPSTDARAMAAFADAGAADAVAESASAPRTIIRTGNAELRVEDIDLGRHGVSAMIRPDLGEHIQNATIDRDRHRPTATITVRIAAHRFDTFLEALPQVGSVRSVTTSAADATDQLVDIEARLRNEQRIEEEIGELLANRPDAPLEDIVRVRRELASVREAIERLDAQRQSVLARAALSTMRITLIGPVAERAPSDDDRPGFGARVRTALADGWRTCTDSVVWLAEIAIAGLVWWIAAGVAIVIALRRYRRSRAWR